MKNFIQPGANVTLTAPSGGVVSGNLYLRGGLKVVALGSAAEGAKFVGVTEGVFAFVAAANWTEGARAFYHVTNHTVTPTSASGLVPIGHFVDAGSSGGGATAMVRLDNAHAVAV